MIDSHNFSDLTLKTIEEIAERKSPKELWRHLGTIETGSTYRRNITIFQSYLLKQRVLHGYSRADLSLELFGQKLSTPILVAPVGSFHMAGPRTEADVLSGATKANTMLFVAHNWKTSLEELVKAPHPPMAIQVYFTHGFEDALKRIKQGESLGFSAAGVTIDGVQPTKTGDLLVPGRGPGTSLSPKDIEKLRKETSLPLFVKGIMCEEDARLAVDAGADCIIVSNHGGRNFDYSRAPLEAIPEIVRAVGNKATVLSDSGYRRGSDAMKALALGVKGVLVGRPIFWGAVAGGDEGVYGVLHKLTDELKRSMISCGIPSLDKLGPDVLIKNQYFSIMPSGDLSWGSNLSY